MAVDFIFCSTVQIMLNSLTRDNLDEAISLQLESLAFDHFKPKAERQAVCSVMFLVTIA
jgi:hypothetical protein